MKEKILAELVKKFPGLSKEYLGFIAEKLSAKITDETKIEGAINELDERLPIKDQVEFLQREGDRRVSEAKKKFEDDQKKKSEGNPTPTPAPNPTPDSDLVKQFKELSDKLAAMEKKDAAAQLYQTLTKKLTEKRIPLQFAKGRVIETEDQLNTVLAEVEADYNEVKQGFVNDGLKESSKEPFVSQGKPEGVKVAIKDWAEKDKAKV